MIETDRLILKPLLHDQLLKYIRDDHSLEKEFGLLPTKKNISKSLHDALQKTILPIVFDKDKDYLYHTLWVVISKPDQKMVGDICFVGEPDADGEIEIGYGTYEEFRGKGFMTEAVGRITEWAKEQPKVKSIYAATEKNNVASYSILEKNHFVNIGEVGDMLSWKIELK
ncbi:GNAT family N-acetyltransferase [Pedobacter sp. MC2016-05]|uniref:GNAT family N-acetyltransferase n=1 Tax=Pedobacter sp. MC2016-05 TaxID=2994474 RepID=UPI0022476E62|nr:GNAT family N-acetyltransferase [Pedobacter sp. MC2016-05]MCX2474224.1 GNAT family N-acetyltransferase [Pedobacter sp. MC2016-05]